MSEHSADGLFGGSDGTESPAPLPDPSGRDGWRDAPELPPFTMPPLPNTRLMREAIAAALGEDPTGPVDQDPGAGPAPQPAAPFSAAPFSAGAPNVAQPAAAQPNSAPPNVAQPNGAPPNVAQPNGAPPNVAQPNGAPPNVAQPNGAPPNVAQPNGAPFNVAPSTAAQPNAAQPNGAPPNVAQPNGAPFNVAPSTAAQPNAAQPNVAQANVGPTNLTAPLPRPAPQPGGPRAASAPGRGPRPVVPAPVPPAAPPPQVPAGLRSRYRPPLVAGSRRPVQLGDLRRRVSRQRASLPLQTYSNGGAGLFFAISLIIFVVLAYGVVSGIVEAIVRLLP